MKSYFYWEYKNGHNRLLFTLVDATEIHLLWKKKKTIVKMTKTNWNLFGIINFSLNSMNHVLGERINWTWKEKKKNLDPRLHKSKMKEKIKKLVSLLVEHLR